MKRIICFILLTEMLATASAQTKPAFWEDVQTIRKYDDMYAPQPSPVLFTGSSSIRKWDDAETIFARHKVLNRGIGGAVLNDIIFYADDLIFRYNPKQIVLYIGENDLPDSTSTADSILNRTIRLMQAIRRRLPDVPVLYISMKPSPSREQYLQKAVAANELIRKYLATDKHARYIDIFTPMLNNGKLRPELFVKDMLHMNAQGYAIWRKAVEKYLL